MSGTAPDWARADALLERALDLPPGERRAFVADAVEGDEDLRELLERLLAAAETGHALLDAPLRLSPSPDRAAGPGDPSPRDDLVGQRVGPYLLTDVLGRGGMAVVYLGRRTDGAFDQEVAVKVLKRGADGHEVLERFRRERQILAASSHENLARIFDSGETADGRPYFVMERVDGRRIDLYCDDERLPVRDRVELVIAVSRAVEDAHRRLVVHRDIKPSNILVTPAGRPKLLDFGIAKLLDDPDGEATQTRSWFLTPAYAAPEQIAGEPVTTATDVYQLGLLLFELLTGTLPHGTRGGRRTVEERSREEAPTRPTEALAAAGPDAERAAADRRGASVGELRRLLRGDLESIVLKALRKSPEARYGSVAELADDLDRWRDGRPVRARPPLLGYRVRRFVGRHRGPVAAAGMVLVLVVAYAVSMAWQNQRLARERDRANVEARTAREVADFLADLFREGDPTRARDAALTARELLDTGAARLAGEEIADPVVRARLQAVIGDVYRHLGDYPRSEALLAPAAATLADRLGPDHPETLEARHDLIHAVHLSGRIAEARRLADDLLATERRALGEDDPRTLQTRDRIGEIAHTEGRLEAAEAAFRENLARRAKTFGVAAPELAYTKDRLARILISRGALAEAESLTRAAIDGYLATRGPDHPSTLVARAQLGRIRDSRGAADEAATLFEEAIRDLDRVIGPRHPTTLATRSRLAMLEHRRGNLDVARTLHEASLEGMRDAYGPDHPATHIAEADAVATFVALGREEEAIDLAQQAAEGLHRTVGPDSPYTLSAEIALAGALEGAGRIDEAGTLLAAAAERAARALGPTHGTTHRAWLAAAAHAARHGRDDEAMALLGRAADAGARSTVDDAAFARLRAEPAGAALLARLAGQGPPSD